MSKVGGHEMLDGQNGAGNEGGDDGNSDVVVSCKCLVDPNVLVRGVH